MNSFAANEGPCHHFDRQSHKPAVIFIPDLFHTPAHYGPLSHHLEDQGHRTFALTLPSIRSEAGKRSAGMTEDVASIRRLLEALVRNEEEIVLVMHSYGAVAGCQTITGLERSLRVQKREGGGVISLVFVGGVLTEEGESIESTMLALGERALPGYAKEETPLIRPVNVPSLLFDDLPPAQAAHWHLHLEPQSVRILTTTISKTCWGSDIPVTYIHCSKDPTAKKVMEAMVAKIRGKKKGWIVRTIDAGHEPFLSRVNELGEMIVQAGKIGRSRGVGYV